MGGRLKIFAAFASFVSNSAFLCYFKREKE